MAEHLVYTERVGGSSPSPPTVLAAFLAALLLALPAAAQVRTPADRCVEPNPSAERPGWFELFDGESLAGWRANAGLFKVEDGAIVAFRKGRYDYGYLFYSGCLNGGVFRNFELEAEILQEPNSNSGLAFHTEWQRAYFLKKGQQVQIATEAKQWLRTGSLYHLWTVKKDPVEPNEWFTLRVRVEGPRVVIGVNGRTLVDYVEPEDFKPTAEKRRLASGAFAIEAHGGRTHFRAVRVKPLP